jgi:hypothetical protein
MISLSVEKRQDFDNAVLAKANAYACAWFLGHGQWRRNYFLSLDEARQEKADILAEHPQARIILRALVVGPNGPEHSAFVE